MNESNTLTEEHLKFYKQTLEGRWQRKSPGGSYVEIKDDKMAKRFHVLPAKPVNWIE